MKKLTSIMLSVCMIIALISAAGRLSEFSHVIERAHKDAKPKLLPQDYIYVTGGVAIVLVIGSVITVTSLKRRAKKGAK